MGRFEKIRERIRKKSEMRREARTKKRADIADIRRIRVEERDKLKRSFIKKQVRSELAQEFAIKKPKQKTSLSDALLFGPQKKKKAPISFI